MREVRLTSEIKKPILPFSTVDSLDETAARILAQAHQAVAEALNAAADEAEALKTLAPGVRHWYVTRISHRDPATIRIHVSGRETSDL